jgi:hypothetical protein
MPLFRKGDIQMDIRKLVSDAIAAEVSKQVAMALGTPTQTPSKASDAIVWSPDGEGEQPDEQPKKRRRRRSGPRIGYRVSLKKNGSPVLAKLPDMTDQQSAALSFIVKHGGKARKLVTARDLENGLQMKRKSDESAVWFLRHIKAIESVELDK